MYELPISKPQSLKAIKWLRDNFEDKIASAVENTPFSVDIIIGIACQETAYRWVEWIDKYDVDTILKRCVFDATGDVPGTEGNRKAFPVNLAAFKAKYGEMLANMLVDEGNAMRKIMGWQPSNFLYKGYGIFQNDLQNIVTNEKFFTDKKWYNFDDCLAGCISELKKKYAIQKNVPESIRAYNGSGAKANQYRDNVLEFMKYADNQFYP